MRLKVMKMEQGREPDQVSVSINANDGEHFLVINKQSIDGNKTINVGYPVGHKDGYRLIELPEEADDGTWRVWVPEGDLMEELKAAE